MVKSKVYFRRYKPSSRGIKGKKMKIAEKLIEKFISKEDSISEVISPEDEKKQVDTVYWALTTLKDKIRGVSSSYYGHSNHELSSELQKLQKHMDEFMVFYRKSYQK
jgi:hypothetical protein